MFQKSLIILFLICTTALFSQESWELKKEDDKIKIYTRSVSHSKFKEYKAMTVVNTNLGIVLKELLDAPAYSKDHKSGVSYYVKALGENQHVFYAQKKLPWPFKNRDIVTLLTVEHISETKIKLHLESLPDGIPKLNDAIRIKTLMGYWLLEAVGEKTLVTQQLHINPEGALPPAIVNSLLVKGPYKTFSQLHHIGQ